jgi:two-component system sensor histidine kinase PilS (NtrC family)
MHRIEHKSDDPTVAECVGMVLEETDNLKRLADEFSLYARLPEPHKQPVDLHDLVRQMAELYLSRGEIEVRWRGWNDPPVVQGDPGQLRQVFANLLKNSAEAMGGKGAIELGLLTEDGRAIVRLRDSGPGLPGDPGAVFEPYFTTKSSGTGLGLAIARKIVEDHGGALTAENGESGAVFRLELPTAAGADELTRGEEA